MIWSSAGRVTSICRVMERNATPDLATKSSSRLLPQHCLSLYHQVRGTRKEWSEIYEILICGALIQYLISLLPSIFYQWSSMVAFLRWPAPCLPTLSPPTPRPVTLRPAETSSQQSVCCILPSLSIALERSTALPSEPSGSTLETVIYTACITLFG